MIRINLLPVRAARKKESIRQQISVVVLVLVLVFSIMAFMQISLERSVDALQEELARVQSEIDKYQRLMVEVNKYKKQKKMIESKIAVIEKLEKNRQGPLLILDKMSRLIPESAWLESIQEKRGLVEIKGIAADEQTIADFMRSLENSKDFEKIELVITRQKKKADMNLKSFTVTFRIKRHKGKSG